MIRSFLNPSSSSWVPFETVATERPLHQYVSSSMSLLLANQASPPPTPPLPRCSTKQPLPQSAPPYRKSVSSYSSLVGLYFSALPPCHRLLSIPFHPCFFLVALTPPVDAGFCAYFCINSILASRPSSRTRPPSSSDGSRMPFKHTAWQCPPPPPRLLLAASADLVGGRGTHHI